MKSTSASTKGADSSSLNASTEMTLEGAILDVDYLNRDDDVYIRLTVKGMDGKSYEIFDDRFKPYFYFVPNRELDEKSIMDISVVDNGRVIKPTKIQKEPRYLFGKKVNGFKVFVKNPSNVPKLSSAMQQYGSCYEYDIPFAKRYTIDSDLIPLTNYRVKAVERNGKLFLMSLEKSAGQEPEFNVMCFDIEVYNPVAIPRPEKDSVLMISYAYKGSRGARHGVITFKKVELPFVEVVKSEKEMIKRFADIVEELDVDIVAGYNSANFDVRYLIERAKAIKTDFNISRFEGETRIESHGLVDRVKIGGRVHVDMYIVVAKFIAVVGSAEYIMKLNRYTLKNVYEAISNDKKLMIEKAEIYKLWDSGKDEDLKELATYNLNDADALQKVYETFIPVMIEVSRITYDVLSDVAVSTTGQLVEFTLMRYSHKYDEVIPNKPTEGEIRTRMTNPIEGAYVKTPEPGVYSDLAMFDFRGLYPSLIISYNIDPSAICGDCAEYHESPTGVRFDKKRKSILPMMLRYFIEQRASMKQAYKKDPSNIFLGARSQALKITSNSAFGYLGYARSRWYSRDCAGSITAYGRQHIKETIVHAENAGFRVLYSDTDSIVILLNKKKHDEVIKFIRDFNSKLPESMELELEDFYKRGVFVGKSIGGNGASGAKKKYALISESGRIKIRGFELVRRDWSRIARDTQRRVLETILREGDPERAAEIVREVITKLKEGRIPLNELTISTQLRKSIDSYDLTSPELAAARKAVQKGLRKKEDVENGVISFIITKHGTSISDRAELEGIAKDYDADYYINKQVLPATMRILKELNFNEDQLKNLGMQKKL